MPPEMMQMLMMMQQGMVVNGLPPGSVMGGIPGMGMPGMMGGVPGLPGAMSPFGFPSGLGSFGGRSPDSMTPEVAGGGGAPVVQSGIPTNRDPRDELTQGAEGVFGVNSAYINVFTRVSSVATGTQSITGVGFKPKNIIFFMNVGALQAASWGFDNGTTKAVVLTPVAGAGTTTIGKFDQNAAASITFQSTTVDADRYDGKISTFDPDGFTISWTRTGTPTATLIVTYMAFR